MILLFVAAPIQWTRAQIVLSTPKTDVYKIQELYNMNEELDDTYKAVFRQCYPKLLFYATRLVGTEEAEDVVQAVFVELWRRRDSVVIGEQILAFIYRYVYPKAINLLKHQVIENNYSAAMIEIYERRLQYYQPDHAEVIKKIENQELRQEIFGAINRCV